MVSILISYDTYIQQKKLYFGTFPERKRIILNRKIRKHTVQFLVFFFCRIPYLSLWYGRIQEQKRGSFSETASISGDIQTHKRICTTCDVCRERREVESNAKSEHRSRSLHRSRRRVCFHSTYPKLYIQQHTQ